MHHNLDRQICFKYKDKIYFGKITNEIGTTHKEYKVIALEDNGELLICWIKASEIIKDRRHLNRRKDLDK
jgi:hypothetical protein